MESVVSEGAAPETPERQEPLPPKKTCSPEWTINRMKKLTRRFNIDLAPKVGCQQRMAAGLFSNLGVYYCRRRAPSRVNPSGDEDTEALQSMDARQYARVHDDNYYRTRYRGQQQRPSPPPKSDAERARFNELIGRRRQ